MSDRSKNLVIFLFIILSFIIYTPCLFANNLQITNGTVVSSDSSADTATIQFDISWDNSWRDEVNYDAAWVFIKYSTDGSTWEHATFNSSGTNPSGYSTGSGTGVEILVPTDRMGGFIQRSTSGTGSLDTDSVQVVWDYGIDGVSDSDISDIGLKIFGIEMVYCSEGAFYAGGDHSAATGPFQQGSADTDPWYITSENAIVVENDTSDVYYEGGDAYTIPTAFPKGYNDFYLMKYEFSCGQYVDFLNCLSRDAQDNRTETDVSTDSITNVYVMIDDSSEQYRNRIICPASNNGTTNPIVFSCDRPDRACNYLGWPDVAAFLDWAALRPMSELEYEKAARGKDQAVVSNEGAWGSSSGNNVATISGDEDGTETASASADNCMYARGAVYSGGDGGEGPLRCGIVAGSSETTRETTGAGYYGAMELSGNLWEFVIAVGTSGGREFQGSHGDGELESTSSYEGNATNSDWPGWSSGQGVSDNDGATRRGGEYSAAAARVILSDRNQAESTLAARERRYGGRGARTAP